jgi:hypothetical protein
LLWQAPLRDNAAYLGKSKGRTTAKRRKIGGIERSALNLVGDAANPSPGDAPHVIWPMWWSRPTQPQGRLDGRWTSSTALADDLDSG